MLTTIVFGTLLTAVPPATGGPPDRNLDFRAYELSPATELPIAGFAAALATSYFLVEHASSARVCSALTCTASSIRGLDRFAIGRDSAGARSASDITLWLSVATPLVLELAMLRSGQSSRFEGLIADAVVLSEVFAVTALTTAVLKRATARARPWVYAATEDVLGDSTPNAFESFPSGHSSLAFAGAVAGCSLYLRRMNPSFAEGAAICLPGLGLATATAMLRIEGGRHFPTDVLAGAAIGVASGLIIPWLHGDPRTSSGLSPSVTPVDRGAVLGISGSF